MSDFSSLVVEFFDDLSCARTEHVRGVRALVFGRDKAHIGTLDMHSASSLGVCFVSQDHGRAAHATGRCGRGTTQQDGSAALGVWVVQE